MEHTYRRRFELEFAPLRRAASQAEPGLIDGRAVADAMERQLGDAVDRLERRGVRPRLAFVQVGRDPASEVYVRNKRETCRAIGIDSDHVHLGDEASHEDVLEQLDALVHNDSIHGVLLQLPLPERFDEQRCLERIPADQDVDGFQPANLGALMAGESRLEPCTPRGIMTLLEAIDVDCRGRRAVVVGRSRIVGRPMAQMLMRAHATVTVCHRHTEDLAEEIERADLVVAATGVADLVRGDWIQPGSVVIDVGITRREDGTLTGDVDFDSARRRADYITPVPGGVGPMTVATLMENTIRATCWQHDISLVDESEPSEAIADSEGGR